MSCPRFPSLWPESQEEHLAGPRKCSGCKGVSGMDRGRAGGLGLSAAAFYPWEAAGPVSADCERDFGALQSCLSFLVKL